MTTSLPQAGVNFTQLASAVINTVDYPFGFFFSLTNTSLLW
jgi:hypothetical protein